MKSCFLVFTWCLVLQQRRPVEVCVLEETAARPPGGHQEGRSRQVEGGMSHPLQYGMVHREFSTQIIKISEISIFRRICQKMKANFRKRKRSWKRRTMRLPPSWARGTSRRRSRRKFLPCRRSASWTMELLCLLTRNSDFQIFHVKLKLVSSNWLLSKAKRSHIFLRKSTVILWKTTRWELGRHKSSYGKGNKRTLDKKTN